MSDDYKDRASSIEQQSSNQTVIKISAKISFDKIGKVLKSIFRRKKCE